MDLLGTSGQDSGTEPHQTDLEEANKLKESTTSIQKRRQQHCEQYNIHATPRPSHNHHPTITQPSHNHHTTITQPSPQSSPRSQPTAAQTGLQSTANVTNHGARACDLTMRLEETFSALLRTSVTSKKEEQQRLPQGYKSSLIAMSFGYQEMREYVRTSKLTRKVYWIN
jgi:hypothetical protein